MAVLFDCPADAVWTNLVKYRYRLVRTDVLPNVQVIGPTSTVVEVLKASITRNTGDTPYACNFTTPISATTIPNTANDVGTFKLALVRGAQPGAGTGTQAAAVRTIIAACCKGTADRPAPCMLAPPARPRR